MRHTQFAAALPEAPEVAADALQELLPGRPLRLQAARGWLTVVAGSVWLTRLDDLEDHWLSAGQSMHLTHARSVVVEAWDHRAARIVWHAEQAAATAPARVRDRRSGVATLARRVFDTVVRLVGRGAAATHGDNRAGSQQGRAHVGHGGSRGAGHGAWA